MAESAVEALLVRGGEGSLVEAAVRRRFPGVRILDEADRHEATIVAGRVDDRELALLPNLGWVHSWAAGVEGEIGSGLRAAGLPITSSAGNGAIPLAEHALMLALMLDRDAVRWLDAQRERRWHRHLHGELAGRTLGILGFGNVGRELAVRAKAMGMRVVALRRRPTLDAELVDRMLGPDDLLELAATSDVLVVAAARTPALRGAIGARELAALGEDGILIVVSRGGIVDEDALVTAMRYGTIRAAGIDAHAVEPLPAESPIWTLPNTVVTPHNGATTAGTAARGTAIFLENLARRIAGAPLHGVVDVAQLDAPMNG